MDTVTHVHPDLPGAEREVRSTPKALDTARRAGWAPKGEAEQRSPRRRRSEPEPFSTGAAEGGTDKPSDEDKENV